MRKVSAVLFTAIVCTTLAIGTLLLAAESPARFGSYSIIAQVSDTPPLNRSRKASTPPQKRESSTYTYSLERLKNAVAGDAELALYGAIAGFGILMMGLAIGSASSSKGHADAKIELLKQEKEKAENLAKIKSEFLNQVSHELRTPLAVIIGYIECITDGLYGEIEPKHQQILQVVAKQSAHLKNMIDQILIYSRLEAGKQPIRVEDINLSKALSDLRDTFEFLCRQKGISLNWEVQSESIFVRSDTTRLKEVISNLLQNAVKYTDKGSISLRAEPFSNNSIMIEVEDSGIGIAETHLASIFEPFMQVHKTSTENSRGGIGLGLSIVKKHLEQIGGKITVRSELGKGSVFRIIVPRNLDRRKSRTHRIFNWFTFHAKRALNPPLVTERRARSNEPTHRKRALS